MSWRDSIWQLAEHVSPQVGEPWIGWPYLRTVCGWILQEMADRPEGARIVFNAPPRHGKSLLISKWLPVWFLEMCPEKRVALGSYGAELAGHWGRQVRDVFLNCPELWTKVHPGSGAANRWDTTEGGGMLTAGVGGSWTGFGYSLGLVDDPCKDWQDAHSPTMRQHERDWFDSTFYTRREPGAHIVVLMQRWHEEDLTGYLTKYHSDDWLHITLPAIAEENDALGRAEGEPLCPERFDTKALEAIKQAQQSKWWGLYMQRPLPAEGSIIKPQWLGWYDEVPRGIWLNGISVDATFDETAKGSYVALQVWGEESANYYLLDQVRARMDFTATVAAINRLMEKWPGARAKWIEKKANGAAIISVLRKSVSGLIPIEPKGSKEARLQAVSPLFEAGNVKLPRRAPWVQDYVDELTHFPSSAQNDQVDATSQALLKMSEKRRMAVVHGGGYVVPAL